jgi:hypothetical protein
MPFAQFQGFQKNRQAHGPGAQFTADEWFFSGTGYSLHHFGLRVAAKRAFDGPPALGGFGFQGQPEKTGIGALKIILVIADIPIGDAVMMRGAARAFRDYFPGARKTGLKARLFWYLFPSRWSYCTH